MSQFIEPFHPHQSYPHAGRDLKPKQAPVDIYTLFPNIDRWALGYESMLKTLESLNTSKNSFPPYNITKNGDNYTIEMALAGFRKDDIEVVVKERTLTIRSEIEDKDVPDEGKYGKVLHHGIAQRNFTTNFALGEYVEVKSAKLADGLLTIRLETELPEEKKSRQIKIS